MSGAQNFCPCQTHENPLSGPRLRATVAISLAPYRSHSGASGPKSQKSRKKVPGASRPRGQERLKKSRKKVKNESKTTFFQLFQPFFDFFSTFLTPGPRGHGNLFSTFLGFRARWARVTPVRGQGDGNATAISSGVLSVSTWPKWLRYPSPWHARLRCDTPRTSGYLSNTCAIASENTAKCVQYPLCNTFSKGSCAILGWCPRSGPLRITMKNRETLKSKYALLKISQGHPNKPRNVLDLQKGHLTRSRFWGLADRNVPAETVWGLGLGTSFSRTGSFL